MKQRTLTPSNLLIALIGFFFLTSLSVVIVLNFRPLYYFDIGYLNLANETGYSEEVIRENYDVLIDYNLLTDGTKELTLPDFPMSQSGRTHFWEVKEIFVAVQILCIVCGVLLIPSFLWKRKQRNYGSLKLISIFSFAVPIVLGICVAVSWETFFLRFHQLFFNNDFWLFDPATDPVILILPDEFFAQCAVAILLIIFLGGILAGILYWRLNRTKKGRMKNEYGESTAV